ncbi:hypothetical protein [Lutispora sp.]|uniref:hypothetical protein n=1 Tax=Lutispora sp. TaxID=2828727 RepID=UPI003564C240
MIKIGLPIILSIIICVGLVGCTNYKDKAVITENQPSEITEVNGKSISGTAQPPADAVQIKTSDPTSKGGMVTIDYSQYLKKIWVVISWNGGTYEYSSFFISKIKDGKIEGKFSTRTIAMPDFYYYSLKPSKYLGVLNGTIKNGIAECYFSDKAGNKGHVTLVFNKNDEIEATIKYTDKEEHYNDLSLDGIFLFRPYNLEDIESFTQFEDLSFTVDLNSWGNVNFVAGESDGSNKVHPVAYITNEHDDILYEFKASFQTGSEIIETSIMDINEDGLKDVVIITAFNDPDIEHIERVFLQTDDGLFYSSRLDAE